MKRRIGDLLLVGASLGAMTCSLPLIAQAQESPARTGPVDAGSEPHQQATPPLEAIVVTGSRIARTGTFETPTPVTAISAEQLEAKAATTVIDLLRDVPALRPNRISGGGRSIGSSNFNMRSLGPTRTLVLLDGQRLMDSSPVGGFDLNVIPAPLIERIDIVTAGVSSVYGSDAVTGVVNVILNDHFNGGKFDAQYNTSTHGDRDTTSTSLSYGGRFAGDRGRFIVAASYLDTPDILYQGARDWGRRGYTMVPNAAYTPTNGQFRQLIVPDVRLSRMTLGGVITSAGPLRNIQFGANGAQSPFVQGTNVGTVWMQGGEGLMTQPDYGALVPATEQKSLFGRSLFDITSDIEAHLDVLAVQSKNESTNNFNYNNGDITIRRDNPYLPANILATMVANNLQTITVGRLNPETGINYNTSDNEYYRFGAGIEGPVFGDWRWEIGASYTHAFAQNTGENNRNQANWTRALDVVAGPGGQPICRSTLTDPTNGCVPANIFGLGSVSPAAVAYVTGTSFQRSHSSSANVSANVSGSLGATWAGPIGVATGIEYREDDVNSKSDPISDINGWRQGTFGSYRGSLDVGEVYAEASVPLAVDQPWARRLEMDLAGRYVDYSTSGTANVWKVGLNWTINDVVRLRGTYSKDFRAPKIDDLFSASSLRAGQTVLDFQTNAVANVNTITGGNPNLKPEIAHTLTGGVVISPLEGLQFSVDYFDIELDDALTTFTAQEIVDRCGQGNQTLCAGIIRDGSGAITTVLTTQFNAQVLKTSGLDIEAAYRFPLSSLVASWSGDLDVRAVGTYVDKLATSTGGPEIDVAGQLTGTLGTPHWRAVTTVAYTNGPLSLRTLFNYVGEGKYDNTYGPLDLNRNRYPSYLYMDLSAQYDLTARMQIYAKVENVFDKDPPLLASPTITVAAATTSPFHDVLGRMFGAGIRYRW
jgi:outer membrane receptor protein involved in Fe transport